MNEDIKRILLEMQQLTARMTVLRNKLTSLQGACPHKDHQSMTAQDGKGGSVTKVLCQDCCLLLSETREP
jgi:hypothetical protein